MTIARSVFYCKICSIPPEFCQYTACAERCKKALVQDNPELYAQLYEPALAVVVGELNEKLSVNDDSTASVPVSEEASSAADLAANAEEDADKKHQSRGGKGLQRDEAVRLDKEAQKRAKARITLKRTDRNKRKAVTHIYGFELFGLDLKKVAKKFAGKYACGCSVVKDNNGKEEIDLQGDFIDDLLDYIPKEFPEIHKKQIDVIEK